MIETGAPTDNKTQLGRCVVIVTYTTSMTMGSDGILAAAVLARKAGLSA